MAELPQNLYRAVQIKKLEQLAIDDHDIAGAVLMDRAAQAAFALIQQRWPNAKRLVVLCGVGNNGGDGFVVAKLAKSAGLDVSVFLVGDEISIKDDALTANKSLLEAGVSINPFKHGGLNNWDVIVDALLGTGLSRDVTGIWRSAIEAINRSEKPVISLDLPSGLQADTGRALGIAVKATMTITFVGLKQGMFTAAGPFYCGELQFDKLALPDAVYTDVQPASRRLDLQFVSKRLTKRSRTANKGHYGHVLIIGGDNGMSGAVKLAGEAAARVGAGLVSIATRKAHAPFLNINRPELMVHDVDISSEIKPLLEKATVVGIGPGLGQSSWAEDLLASVLATDLPVVMDADALNLLAKDPLSRKNWVLTPHPGEAARLMDSSVEKIETDRFASILEIQQRYGGIVVLKGKGSLVTADDFSIDISTGGNPGMASGGMGDVLTGVICGLIAQRLSLIDATKVAVFIHSEAADRASRYGERGMLASDLMIPLRQLVNVTSSQ